MKKYFLYLFLITVLCPLNTVFAEVDPEIVQDLQSIEQGREAIKRDIAEKESFLNSEKDEDRKQELQKEIDKLDAKLTMLEDDLDNTAADLDIFVDDEENDQNRDVNKDVQDVLSPIIKSFRRMSARPRLLERLRDELSNIDEKMRQIDVGLKNIALLEKSPEVSKVKGLLADSKQRILDYRTELVLDRKDVQRQLDDLKSEDKGFLHAGEDLVRDFFNSKGKNILVSLLAALSVLGLLLVVKAKILKPILRIEKLVTVSKPIMAFYGVFAGIISVITAVMCLFLLNDWLLFTLSVLFIGAVLWAFKHLVLNFIGAIRVILDMGTVREGERVMFEDCPWLVKKVGLRTHLVNERLEGGSIYVNIGKVKEFVSRPVVKDEPWFPTRKNDYVLLADGTYGKVTVQTPDQIVVLVDDAGRKFYSLKDFIAAKPLNLSDGFMVTTYINVDYDHQKKIFDIVDIFREELRKKFGKETVTVDFAEAGADSLNIVVNAVYDGSMAHRYLGLRRELNAYVVDISNRNKISIPFEQLTVHVQK